MKTDPGSWWRDGVVYQIYPRSFQDSNGDGTGDLPGIISRLPYLVWLGVDAIWLSPFYPSPGADFGYDVSDYTGVDPIFGSLGDFTRLLSAAHAHGLKLIIDFVPNHTSDQHSWFLESRSSRDNSKRDWYTWRAPKPDGSPPNNWLAVFGGPSWTFDELTGEYYMHSFLPQQPDVNWRNPAVKAAMFYAMRFWLDRGVDGFRIDVAHYLMKDPELRDNPPNPEYRPGALSGAHKSLGEHESQLHVNDRNHPDIHPLYREIRALVDSYGERVTIGEVHLWDLADWASYYGTGLDEIHLPFNFGLLKTPWQVQALREHIEAVESAVPQGGWPNYVLGNHDEGRVATRLGPEHAGIAMMLLLTLRGTPTLYYGDELGMENVVIPPDRERDPWGLRVPGLGLSRDPGRTPMQWDATRNAGFTASGSDPWLPLDNAAAVRNVEVQGAEPTSMLSLTRELLHVRKQNAALTNGSYTSLDGLPETVFGYLRQTGSERFAVLLNLGGGTTVADVSGAHSVIASTEMDGLPLIERERCALRPYEGIIVRLSGSAGG